MPHLTEPVRAWIYRLAATLFAVGVAYGVIEQDDVDLWLAVVTAGLGLATNFLAAKNTSTNPKEG